MNYNLDNYEQESEEMQDLILEQCLLENKFREDATVKYDHSFQRMINAGLFANTSEGSILQKLAIESVTDQLKDYFDSSSHRGLSGLYKNFLKDNFEGREDVLAFVVLEFLLNVVSTNSPKLTSVSINLTSKILDLLAVEDFKRNEPKFYSYLEYEYKSRGIGYINSRKRKLADMTGNKLPKELSFKTNIGAILINMVMTSGCNLFEIRTNYEFQRTQKVLGITEEAFNIIGKAKEKNTLFSVTYKPLVAPPLDWSGLYDNGGYYTPNSITFIRNRASLNYIEKHYPNADFSKLYGVINHIQQTKWRINPFVLSVIERIIDDSMVDPSSPDGNPTFYGKVPYMDSLNVYDMIPKERYGAVDEKGKHIKVEDYRRWFKDKEIQLKKLEAIRSKRIMFLLAFNIAQEYKDREAMYFTYNTDFRGRLYPIQQILNPQTTGVVKAFLEFAEGEILDSKGLYWLKIHIANTYGLDKASYEDRIKWVDDQKDLLLDTAQNPFDNIDVWNDADEPLMFLASIRALLDSTQGKKVHLPINLDATCSGLQLYSGLLLDDEGAKAVNVVDKHLGGDKDKPADVYTDVALQVEHYLEEGEYPTRFSFTTRDGVNKSVNTITEANDLQGNVTRKLTKRNVMTVPYSVTKRGMYDQVRELLDEMEDNEESFWKGDKWVVAKLLVELNSKAIRNVIEGASVGQEFVKDIIHDFYKSGTNEPLVWHTPYFNFPVVQHKTQSKVDRINTVLGSLQVRKATNKISKQQQSNGIAPNLIHSLDSTLMYMTVEKLMNRNVKNFMLIHDSFGVPANDVDYLNTAVREAFVELFKSEPLRQWVNQVSKEWEDKIDDVMINTLDLEDVILSTYIFS